MQLIFDNIVAVMIAGVLFLILVAVNHRSQMAAVETSNYYALKQQELSFVEMLKRDMQNVTDLQSITEDPMTLDFSFKARTDPADTTRKQVVYRRVVKGLHDGTQLYQVQRFVEGMPDGGSMSTISKWTMVAQNEQGGQVSDIANARQIFIQFEAMNPFQEGETVDKSRWEATFRPPLLQQANTI